MSETSAGRSRKAYVSTHIFNPGLYLRGLIRLWVPGLAIGIPVMILSLVISMTSRNNLNLSVMLVSYLTPLLFLTAFSFLRSRREADPAFSAPVTRTCLYVTTCLSALTVCVILTAAAFLCTLPNIGRNLYVPQGADPAAAARDAIADYAIQTLFSLCYGILLGSTVTVAIVLSGSIGHSLFLTLLFILFDTALSQTVTAYAKRLPMIYTQASRSVTEFWQNLPFRNLFSLIFGTSYSGSMLGALGIRLLLAALFFVIGWLLFRKRKAENAGDPAAGRGALHFTVCLFIFMLTALACGDRNRRIWWAAGAVALYCVYLLLTTRRLSSLWRCLPYAAVTAAATVLLLGGTFYAIESVIFHTSIDAEEVEAVYVNNSWIPEDVFKLRQVYAFQNTGEYASQIDPQYEYLKLRDPVLIQKIADMINKDKASRSPGTEKSETGLTEDPKLLVVTLYTKDGRSRRYEFMAEKQDQIELYDLYGKGQYELYRKLTSELPPEEEYPCKSVEIGYRSVRDKYPGYKEVQSVPELEAVFREEFETLDEGTKQALAMRFAEAMSYGRILNYNEYEVKMPKSSKDGLREIYIRLNYQYQQSTNIYVDIYTLYFRIDPELMPKTYRYICASIPKTEKFMKGVYSCYEVSPD
ncbi:MAG: hypothetical protein MJ192_00035 [Clostridia bacterium]|nr:hypothetical protein [Clostridia bacterium]